jgi:putative transcriptional regulator
MLASYANGHLSRPMHALVASHLELSPRNRFFVSALESVLGDEVERSDAGPITARDARLSAILADDSPLAATAPPSEGALPQALSLYLGKEIEKVAWRTVLPGVREHVIEREEGLEASLLWIKAGRRLPAHTHEGVEATLVLRGAFSDLHGHYGRGDIAIADAEIDHKPVVDDDGDCLCFAVTEGNLRLTGPIARLFNGLMRR